jgi:hypothetical protein
VKHILLVALLWLSASCSYAQNASVTPEDFGAGIGAEDSEEVQAALDHLESLGGGELVLIRHYPIGDPDDDTVSIRVPSNVTIRGIDPASSGFYALPLTDAHILQIEGKQNITLRNFTIDGNSPDQTVTTGVHAVRVLGGENIEIDGLVARRVNGYGFGFQNYTMSRIRITGNLIEDTGADGIDFKNKDDLNRDILIFGNTIRRHGRQVGTGTAYAGIDVRGAARVIGNRVEQFGDGLSTTGIRLRQGATLTENGYGGHRSTIAENDISGNSAAGTVGIDAVAQHARVINNGVEKVSLGIQSWQMETVISGNIILDSTNGIKVLASLAVETKGDRTDAANVVVTSNVSRSNTTHYIGTGAGIVKADNFGF